MIRKTRAVGRSSASAENTTSDQGVLDVTIVILDAGHPSTAIGPLEVFHAAGVLWDWLHGNPSRPEQFVTEDNRLLCSGGVYASIDLSLYLVEKFCGHEIALQCAKSLLLSMPRARQSGYSVLPLSRPHSDERIRKIEEYLQQNF